MNKIRIDKVINTNKNKEVLNNYKNKVCKDVRFDIGKTLRIKYEDNMSYAYEIVSDVVQDLKGFKVVAGNRVWHFSKGRCLCSGGSDFHNDCLDIRIVGNKIKIGYDAYSCDSSFDTEIEASNCFICGRKLTTISSDID